MQILFKSTLRVFQHYDLSYGFAIFSAPEEYLKQFWVHANQRLPSLNSSVFAALCVVPENSSKRQQWREQYAPSSYSNFQDYCDFQIRRSILPLSLMFFIPFSFFFFFVFFFFFSFMKWLLINLCIYMAFLYMGISKVCGRVGVNLHNETASTKDLMSILFTFQGYSTLNQLQSGLAEPFVVQCNEVCS